MAASDRNALGLTAKESDFALTFDLSTAGSVRKWFFLPPSCGFVSVDGSWTSTGTPVGVFSFEVSNSSAAESGTPIAASSDADFVAQQPGHASDTGSFFADNIMCSARRFCVAYTRTSGGTGATATVTVSFKTRG